MKRRSFMTGVSALAMGQLVSGCNNNQKLSLKVKLLQDSVPVQLLGEFRKVLQEPINLKFEPESQLNNLYKSLGNWKKQVEEKKKQSLWDSIPLIGHKNSEIPSLVTLGDSWLEAAIKQKLIQPLKIEELGGWKELSPVWRKLVTRNEQGELDKSGLIWGAPYRWGTTVIAYRRDKFEELGWKPKDWSDLWRADLRDRISLLDQPREIIGLTLKKMGLSYNQTDLSQIPNLKKELLALHRQAKLYSSDRYLEPLVLEDTWVAVGWSTDILSLGESVRDIEAVVPASGTSLWADLWVQPTGFPQESNSGKTTDSISISKKWIDFCWQKEAAISMSLLGDAPSPRLTSINRGDLPKKVADNKLLLPDTSVMDKSEFIYPISEKLIKQYQLFWEEIRNS
ncbi:MAG TPA: polyamine ABC transporter substrate-binding protein [Cyanobacteria bacterium UBA11149]|nr:polyamine ABC transporter substrate-binding protein [Cyanobacteria bacterium UBA11367]HBE58912.1 polyamine ABC transporter substrate-binding protein [Cyanobacteria bacterium UBA11366]HBK62349.1 polyamine ABC transporter substrate-binding protein [Cyanobacteria bacterium UBA11166]HBR75659.1 polyamine ABC transporter substrate-binding protein [Cyanobacteria bacterium UBA11159]HBS69975.1 polyamine ABC transporter substrate-binding protein [Cyanobacteria bacterium UBA11153]HBW87978.1 polyamine 